MRLMTDPYLTQKEHWPHSGRHILAQFDAETVVVYQAFRPEIGRFAIEHGHFGAPFSLTRMSWIKPNFLWMMFRCGWATKADQETVLAVRLRRDAFDAILAEAVPSSFTPALYADEPSWKRAVAHSSVRLQWDPDHSPTGGKQERRAIQLGLRGDFLTRYAQEWIVAIEDVTDFVHEQYDHVQSGDLSRLVTPREDVYSVSGTLAQRLGMGAADETLSNN